MLKLSADALRKTCLFRLYSLWHFVWARPTFYLPATPWRGILRVGLPRAWCAGGGMVL